VPLQRVRLCWWNSAHATSAPTEGIINTHTIEAGIESLHFSYPKVCTERQTTDSYLKPSPMKTAFKNTLSKYKFLYTIALPVLVVAAVYATMSGCAQSLTSINYQTGFTGIPATVEVGQTVTFTNQSTADGAANYSGSSWTFPGGSPVSSSQQTNVTVVYDTPGTYLVTLVVNGRELTKDNYITVTAATELPVAAFSANDTIILPGGSVNFTDLSTGAPTSWEWTFQGGTPGTSTEQNPTGIVFDNEGDKDITLVASSSLGSNTLVKSNYIAVVPYCSFVYDIDGIGYNVVEIGNHCWMANNLTTSTYRNGQSITTGLNTTDWENNTSGAYKVYNDDNSNIATLGLLYNWYAINNSNGLCPEGWHVATDANWADLYTALGGTTVANPKMRALTTWNPNTGNNSSGFTAYAAGFFGTNNQFAGLETQAYFWSATENDATSANTAQLYNDLDEVFEFPVDKNAGMSCRCVKD